MIIRAATKAKMSNQSSREISRYILSAGRTGTVFLERLIREYEPTIKVEHEPSPSRYLMMLGNLRNDWGTARSLTSRWSQAQQSARHLSGKSYIEINPFLCSVADTLPMQGRELRVLHIIRHPADWARSITTFKASANLRSVIDYVPFSKPYPSPRPANWRQLGNYEKALWRWTWCNTKIEQLKPFTSHYVCIRYEDMFSETARTRMDTLNKLYKIFELKNMPKVDDPIFKARLNPAPISSDARNEAAEKEICGPLAKTYGYELAPR